MNLEVILKLEKWKAKKDNQSAMNEIESVFKHNEIFYNARHLKRQVNNVVLIDKNERSESDNDINDDDDGFDDDLVLYAAMAACMAGVCVLLHQQNQAMQRNNRNG